MRRKRLFLAVVAVVASVLTGAPGHADDGGGVRFLGRVQVEPGARIPENLLGNVQGYVDLVAAAARKPAVPCVPKKTTAHVGEALSGTPWQYPPVYGNIYVDEWTEDSDPATKDGITAYVSPECAKAGSFNVTISDVSTLCEPRDYSGSAAVEWYDTSDPVQVIVGLGGVPYFTRRGNNPIAPNLPCYRYNAVVKVHVEFFYVNNLNMRVQYDCINRSWPIEFRPGPSLDPNNVLNPDVSWYHVGKPGPEEKCVFF